MFRSRIFLTLAAMVVTSPAFAANTPDFSLQTVQAFKAGCDNRDFEGVCIGYITGISSMMDLLDTAHQSRKFAMCLNGQVATIGARVQAFKNWVDKHPEKWGEHALIGVIEAMQETWPCR